MSWERHGNVMGTQFLYMACQRRLRSDSDEIVVEDENRRNVAPSKAREKGQGLCELARPQIPEGGCSTSSNFRNLIRVENLDQITLQNQRRSVPFDGTSFGTLQLGARILHSTTI